MRCPKYEKAGVQVKQQRRMKLGWRPTKGVEEGKNVKSRGE